MKPVARTTIKLDEAFKARGRRAADAEGKSERAMERAERCREFLDDAREADEDFQRSGLGYAANDVFTYFAAVIGGEKSSRPRLKKFFEKKAKVVARRR